MGLRLLHPAAVAADGLITAVVQLGNNSAGRLAANTLLQRNSPVGTDLAGLGADK